jgi:hypothetical protein
MMTVDLPEFIIALPSIIGACLGFLIAYIKHRNHL